jgi:hypothetical protein
MRQRGRGGRPMLRPVGVAGPFGIWCGASGLTWKMAWGDGPTWKRRGVAGPHSGGWSTGPTWKRRGWQRRPTGLALIDNVLRL